MLQIMDYDPQKPRNINGSIFGTGHFYKEPKTTKKEQDLVQATLRSQPGDPPP